MRSIMAPLSLLIGAMEMVIPGLCFLIPGNMDAGNIWPTHPPDKSAINQKPQNCRFVHTDERGQKMRGENRRGNYKRKGNLFKFYAVFRIKDE